MQQLAPMRPRVHTDMRRLLCAAILLTACGPRTSKPETMVQPRVESCGSGDWSIPSSSQCLQDDAACYQLSDGSWCTGGRGHMFNW